MAISSQGATLKWGASKEAVKKVVDIKSFGDLIGEPNNLETTTMTDTAQTFIPGIRQSNTIQFNCNYTKDDFANCKKDENTPLYFELAFNDGSKFEWQGQFTLGVGGKNVDEVIEFSINVLASTPVNVG